jgi:hypothetical protein
MEASRGHHTLQCPIHQRAIMLHRYWKPPAKKCLTRSGGKRPRDDGNNEASQACGELEPCEIEHKACEYHPVIDKFHVWLKELTEMGSENVKDFVGNGLTLDVR